jgi:hypothetical protein
MEKFETQPITSADIATTFPLMRQLVPALDIAGWSRFARHMANPRRANQHGVIIAKGARRAFPSGLFCYHRERDLSLGTVLVADHFVAVDLLDAQPIIEALAAALEQLANRLECRAIRSVVHQATGEVAAGLFAAGHRTEGTTLCKMLETHGTRSLVGTPCRDEFCA